MSPHSFAKAEHLCLKRDIEALFSAGSHALTAYPVRLVYRRVAYSGGAPVQVLVSVAKRRLHHAVDRNRAKRQLREAYRLGKGPLLAALPPESGLHIALIWLAEGPVASAVVSDKVNTLLLRVAERLAAATSAPVAP